MYFCIENKMKLNTSLCFSATVIVFIFLLATLPSGQFLNCDSQLFIWIAEKPSKILETDNVRQDRPTFIFIASLLPAVISAIFPYTQRVHFFGYNVRIQYIYCYVSYIILNIVILILTFKLCKKMIPIMDMTMFSVYLLIIYNDITKAFILSPHTQMLNIFVPIFCLWSFVSIVKGSFFRRKDIFILSVLAGFGVTAYASFFLFLPSVIIPAILTHKPFQRKAALQLLWRSVVILCLVVLPSLFWYLYVLHKTGSFYSHSTEAYHHVVWMKDAFQDGTFVLISKLLNNMIQLVILAAKQGWILLLVLLPFIIGRSEKKIQWQAMLRSPIAIGSIFVSLMFLVFFTMVGLIAARVAYTAIPPMIVLTAYIIQNIEQKSTSLAYRITPVIISAYGIYEVVKDGPYS